MRIIYEHQSHPSGSGLIVKEYVQDYFTSPYHFHDLYEILWVKKSYGKLYAGKTILNFKADDIFIFGPSFGHCLYNEKTFIDLGEKAHAIAIFFKGDLFGEGFFENTAYLKANEVLEKSNFGIHITKGNTELFELFNKLKNDTGLAELITFLKVLNEISNLPKNSIHVLNKTQSTIKLTNKDSARLDPVIKYVMENFRNEIDSKTAANLIHLNHAAFCRYFKKRMEQTFSQFVNNVRIAHATSLLLTKDWDVLRVCYDSGYKNLSYFNRQFREIMLQSPKSYKNTLKGNDERLLMDNQSD